MLEAWPSIFLLSSDFGQSQGTYILKIFSTACKMKYAIEK